jgi:hypothetical protein
MYLHPYCSTAIYQLFCIDKRLKLAIVKYDMVNVREESATYLKPIEQNRQV